LWKFWNHCHSTYLHNIEQLSRFCSHETTELWEKETCTLHFLTIPLGEVLYSPVKICCCCLLRCP
jgi:hypothetical protein